MNQQDKQQSAQPATPKKPYVAPEIISREPLEAMAVICSGGTAKANPIDCSGGPISS